MQSLETKNSRPRPRPRRDLRPSRPRLQKTGLETSLETPSRDGSLGMSGNRISHLGEPLHQNDAVHLSSANEVYLRHDGSNWMRNDIYL